MKKLVKTFFSSLGYDILKKQNNINREETPAPSYTAIHDDISEESKAIYQDCLPYTLLGIERIDSIVTSIDYLIKNNIEGDIVECGVWKGGAMYAAIRALVARKSFNRKIFLFDVFSADGMSSTTNETVYDKDYLGNTVSDSINKGLFVKEEYNFQIEDVRKLLKSTGYPEENIIFKVGRVEDTLPCEDIKKVALLRLDTDWYESTKHELIHLFPKLEKGGVLLIDDYGYWKGCRQAVDEYIEEKKLPLLLHRTDYTGRSVIKY